MHAHIGLASAAALRLEVGVENSSFRIFEFTFRSLTCETTTRKGGISVTDHMQSKPLDGSGTAERPPIADFGPADDAVTIPYRANLLGNIEQALKGLQGYGIMALELIQNADDAGAKTLAFDVRDDGLVVDNDGEFSSCGLVEPECPWLLHGDTEGLKRPCNFHAISEMGSRSKIRASEQIGRFGIGFVSVYQITDMPIVRSAGIEIRLDPQTQKVSKRPIEASPGTRFVLPWASVGSAVRDGLNASPTPSDVVDKVIAEIDRVLRESLLFLRHIERVHLRRGGNPVFSVEIERAVEEVTLRLAPGGEPQRWLVLERSADDIVARERLFERFQALGRLERSRVVKVAVPLDNERLDGLLYAYLPTREATGMPIHVNADFFPLASRKAIVLDGEGHERFWNEALIETAAAVLAENFLRVRDLLGPMRLWALVAAAFERRAVPAFEVFWDRLAEVATETASIWTMQGEWSIPHDTALSPENMTADDRLAVSELGIALIDPELRRHWTVMSTIGAQQLRLSTLVAALESRGDDATAGGGEPLRRLWGATALMIDAFADRSGQSPVLARLKAVPFLLDGDDRPISAAAARRLPAGVSRLALAKLLPGRRIVHADVLARLSVADLVPDYLLDDLAVDIAGAIIDADSATDVIGNAGGDARRFYALLTSFPTDRGAARAGDILSAVPILRTGSGFVSPARGQLPGDFRDPVGHFQIVDTSEFVPGMREFAQHVLHVSVLNFRQYVADHLRAILDTGLTHAQYGALIAEIVNHRTQLDEDGTLGTLADIAFVRTRDGAFARPADCYIWSAPLLSILGDDPARWVDQTWIPSGVSARARDMFEGLGMPFAVAAEHIVARIEAIAETGTLDEIVAGTTPIVRHILERWRGFDDSGRETLSELADIAFLAAIVDGERDEDSCYSPRDVYRAVRAAGFASQVAVVEMTALRQASATVSEFLELVAMPTEPPTSVVVAHLEHCMLTGTAVNDVTYQMLSERLERGDDIASIDRLAGSDFIYVPDAGFIGAGDVFWIPPRFGAYWHSASPRMRQREQLYRRLGVVDAPEPRHFAALALHIAANGIGSDSDTATHAHCLAELAEAMDRGDAGAADAVDMLADEEAFLNLEGDAIWTGEAVWLDSEPLAEAFGTELDDRLVRFTNVARPAILRLLGHLNVPALSDVARFRLARDPDGRAAEEATMALGERADLLLWLAPNRAMRHAMREILSELEIRLSADLSVQAEIEAFDPPVRSAVSSVPAFLDGDGAILHLRSTSDRVDWAAAFRAIFGEVERFCPTADIPPLCLTATFIMSREDRTEAEDMLRASGFLPPEPDGDWTVGHELAEAPEDAPGAIEETDPAEIEWADDAGEKDDIDARGGDIEAGDRATVGSRAQGSAGDRTDDGARGGAFGAVAGGSSDADAAAAAGPNDYRGRGEGADGAGDAFGSADVDNAADEGEDRDDADSGGDRVGAGLAGGEHDGSGYRGGDSADEDPAGDTYGSAAGHGAFGADPVDSGAPGEGGTRDGGTSRGHGTGSTFGRGDYGARDRSAERQARRSRMLTYVSRASKRDEDGEGAAAEGRDLADQIDAAAMKAALQYEEGHGRQPERQPHLNKGYDIVSRSPDGSQRIIEVKGLEDEWTERGIKLSHSQFDMAREHPGEYWIYIVEYARDTDRQRVTALANPFGKVEEYWFDHGWREFSEERASSRNIRLKVGLRVEHPTWGKGVVAEIKSRGLIAEVVVDFGKIEGRRGIPFNSTLKIID